MVIEGEDFLDAPFFADDKTAGIYQIKILVFIFFVELPSFLLQWFVDMDQLNEVA